MFKPVRIALIAAVAAFVSLIPSKAGDTVTLKASQGFDFAKQNVVPADPAKTDLVFAVSTDRKAVIDARKIKSLGQGMPSIADLLGAKSWPNAVGEPVPGYYAVQGRDGKSIYLLTLNSVAANGKPKNWEMSFSWEKLQ